MAGQFEYSKHSDEPNDPQDGQRHGLVGTALLRSGRSSLDAVELVFFFRHDSSQRDEIGNDGHDVDDVHHVFEEVALVRTTNDANDDFEREPHYADSLDEKERVCEIGHFVFFDARPIGRGVEQLVVFEFGQSLQAEDDDRQQNDHHRNDGHHAGGLRTFRVFKQQPHFPLPLFLRQRFLLFFDEAFVFPVYTKSLASGTSTMFNHDGHTVSN